MITPTAMSMTLPFIANSLNSLPRLMAYPLGTDLFVYDHSEYAIAT
jgi:hypothetical protein